MNSETHNLLLQKIGSYQMSEAAKQLLQQHQPLISVGVTASGKDAVVSYIEQTSLWRRVITHTTRAPRPGETTGKDYWFVGEDKMLKLVDKQAFFEVKLVHGDRVYASSCEAYQDVIKAGRKPLLIVDEQGAEEISKYAHNLRPVFILPP